MHSCQILGMIARDDWESDGNQRLGGFIQTPNIEEGVLKAFGRDGQILNAEFDVEETAAGVDIVLHSNGGVSRGKPAYNPDYIATLEAILVRLAALDASLEGAWVDSKALVDLDPDHRRIHLENRLYPVRLSDVADIGELRLQIRRSVSRIGRTEGQTPGTGNKKIRLAISFELPLSLPALEVALRGGALTEKVLVGPLGIFAADRDELPPLASALDLRDVGIRKMVWDLTRDAPPIVKQRVSRYVERGQIGALVKAANGHRCQVCDALGQAWDAFVKPDGTPYIEAHHVVHVSTLGDDVLGPQNVITVCPNHHRQLHFGGATTRDFGDQFEFTLPPHPAFRIRKFRVTRT